MRFAAFPCLAGMIFWCAQLSVAQTLQTPNSASADQIINYYGQSGHAQLTSASGGCCDTCEPACCDPCCDDSCCDDSCCDDGCGGCGGGGACYLFGPDEAWALWPSLIGDDSWLDVGGWSQWGYHSNSTGLFNRNPDRFNAQQQWLYIGKEADGSQGIDFGGRMDFMYGTDAFSTQAFGNNTGRWDYLNGWDYGIYGWALPQLYGEVAVGDVSVKVGHFYTIIGYEVVTAPDNFFYSHAFTMFNSEPFTHTGALATYSHNDAVTFYGGWTAGWDTGFDRINGGSNFLGGIGIELNDAVSFTYATTAGDFGWLGDGYSHSLLMTVDATDNLQYIAQSDLLRANVDGTDKRDNTGFNQYLLYTVNDCVGIGGRYEWFKTDGVSINAITGGINIRPHANMIIRPEYRHQWSETAGALDALFAADTDIFGCDMIFTY